MLLFLIAYTTYTELPKKTNRIRFLNNPTKKTRGEDVIHPLPYGLQITPHRLDASTHRIFYRPNTFHLASFIGKPPTLWYQSPLCWRPDKALGSVSHRSSGVLDRGVGHLIVYQPHYGSLSTDVSAYTHKEFIFVYPPRLFLLNTRYTNKN